MGPNFHRPAPPHVGSLHRRAAAARQTASAQAPGRRSAAIPSGTGAYREIGGLLFGSPELERAGERGAAGQPRVWSAQAALRQALENTAAQRGSYFPAVQGGFDASRNRNAVGVLAPNLASGTALYNLLHAAGHGELRSGHIRRQPPPSGIAGGAGRSRAASSSMPPISR